MLSLLLCLCLNLCPDMEQVIQTLTETATETSSQFQMLEIKLREREADLENKIVDLHTSMKKVVEISFLIVFEY